jgi:hypothetical protein
LRQSPTEDSLATPCQSSLERLVVSRERPNGFRGLASGRGRPAPPLSLTPPSETFARHLIGEVIAGATRQVSMLEVLAYAVFFVLMFGCLLYIMNSLETEETPKDRDR